MRKRYYKPSFCIHPYKRGCKGCKYNEVPYLFDGGCKLYRTCQDTEPERYPLKGEAND